MKKMGVLIQAEKKKWRRQRIIWVGYLSIVFSFIITLAQQFQMNGGSVAWRNAVDMFLYNNTVLFLPFPIALIGGYMIDREYAQDTLKNLLVIPVRWQDLIKAKVVVLLLLVIRLGVFELAISLLAGAILRMEGMTFVLIIKTFFQFLLSNVCITIGILPVILWYGKTGGKYVWGSILSMLIGVSGVFVANGKLVNWHPVTASLSFTTETYHAASVSVMAKSVIALVVYGLVSFVIYIVIYQKKKQLI